MTQSPRVASPTGTRRTWPAWPRKRAPAFEASGELPALAVRRMLRQHVCRHSWRWMEVVEVRDEAAQDEQAGTGCAVAAVRSRERAWVSPPSFMLQGRKRGLALHRRVHSHSIGRTCRGWAPSRGTAALA